MNNGDGQVDIGTKNMLQSLWMVNILRLRD